MLIGYLSIVGVNPNAGTTRFSVMEHLRSSWKLDILCGTQDFKIRGSCNGLVCMSDWSLNLKSRICIYNPSIKKYVRLELELGDDDGFYDVYRLEESGHYLAFGFNPRLNDYKVVMMMSLLKDKSKNMELWFKHKLLEEYWCKSWLDQ